MNTPHGSGAALDWMEAPAGESLGDDDVRRINVSPRQWKHAAIIAVAGIGLSGLLASPATAAVRPHTAPPSTAAAAPAAVAPASVGDPSLSPTPYQGWNTYFGLGGDFDQETVLDVADYLVDSGLKDAGYDIVWLDGGWQGAPSRGEDGLLREDPAKFPDGMAALADAIHDRGLRAGIYLDAGPWTPETEGCGLGSYGHYQEDADTIAAWGYDAVKVDFLCGIQADLDPKTAFTEFAEALRNNASGRDIIFNLCNPVTSPAWGDYPEEQQSTYSWSYAPEIAESWRTYTDAGFVGDVVFSDVMRNYDANAAHPEVAGPGHWSDPDFLVPELGMSDEEFRTQMTMWAIAAAPLVIGSDPRELSETSLDILRNEAVLAVNQDPLGVQGERVGDAGTTETWTKPLADGSVAVALLNRGSTPARVTTTADAVGLKAQRIEVQDAWAGTTTESTRTIAASVPAHGAQLLIVSKATGKPGEARIDVSAPRVTTVDGQAVPADGDVIVAAGSQVEVEVAVHNDAGKPVTVDAVQLSAPDGWQSSSDDQGPARIPGGEHATTTFLVTVPAHAGQAEYALSASLSGTESVSPLLPITVAPAAPAGESDLAHHPWVSGTSGWLEPRVDGEVGGGAITIEGVVHATGIGVGSPSVIRYFLGGQCTTLSGVVGIDDAVKWDPSGGTATFAVEADGESLWESGLFTRGPERSFEVDVSGAQQLVLAVGDGGDGGYNDRADWADLSIRCS